MNDEVKVTRKYQVTIPESVRSELGVKIGDKLTVKSENKRIIMETSRRLSNPSDSLWCLFGKSIDIDAVMLVEESWNSTFPLELKRLSRETRKENTA